MVVGDSVVGYIHPLSARQGTDREIALRHEKDKKLSNFIISSVTLDRPNEKHRSSGAVKVS